LNKLLFHTAFKYRLSRHILFFVVLVLLFTLVLYSRNGEQQFIRLLKLTFINALIFLSYAYVVVFILIPAFITPKKYLLFLISFLACGFVLSAIKLSISDFIFYSSISPEYQTKIGIMNVRFILINTKDMSFVVALFVILKFTKDWLIVESQHRSLQKKFDELNMMLLQNHFEPHFLFNTLNNLYALSLTDHEKTLDIIQRFRRLLEFAIEKAQMKKVLLKEEVEMIADFVEIEKIRYGSRLQLKSKSLGSCENLMIEPFLLFPLVDNCFKHGSSLDAGKPTIELTLSCDNRHICFETKNSFPNNPMHKVNIKESGLDKLRKRLDYLYPMQYSLRLEIENELFTAKLELELN